MHYLRNRLAIAASVLGILVLTAACSSGNSPSTPTGKGGTGKITMAVSDAAANMGSVSSVQMTVNSVEVHSNGGAWTTLSSDTKTFDLMQLNANGTAQLLAQADLAAGTYDQIRMDVSKVVVVDAGGQHDAKLPSNTLTLKGTFDVAANAASTANFDVQGDESLHMTGNGTYVFAPVIQLETRANATVQVASNNAVTITGGVVKTGSTEGMNVEGTTDVGLRISPDAILSIGASGKVVQTKGHALISGAIKSVDTANGTVTITTQAGSDVVLHATSDASIKVNGSASAMSNLSGSIGSEIVAQYDYETKALTRLAAGADAQTKADVGATIDLSGTIKSVNAAAGTITVQADSGAEVVLKVASDSKLQLDGGVSNLLGLGAKVGSRIDGEYNASAGAIASLNAQAQANVTAAGTVKAVDATKGTVTITTQAGADVVVNVASTTEVAANGTIGTLASLKSMIGSQATVTYSQSTMVATDLSVQGKAEASATISGVIKSADAAKGTVTVTASGGQEIVLNVTASTSIVADGAVSTVASLAADVGAQVNVTYNTQTNAAATISAQSQASTTASIAGTLKAVSAIQGTVTITSQSGADVVLKVTNDTKLLLSGAATTMASLATDIGAQVTASYNAQTNTATSVQAQGMVSGSVIGSGGGTGTAGGTGTVSGGSTGTGGSIGTGTSGSATTTSSVSGALKAVNVLQGTVTITTQSGADLVLSTSAATKVTVNGAVSTVAALATKIGGQVTVQYSVQTNIVTSIDVK